MWRNLRNAFLHLLVASFVFVGFAQSVQAAMIGTGEALAAISPDQDRAHLLAALDRPEIQAQLEQFGIGKAEARDRVAALSDQEAANLAGKLDTLPAGGDGIIGALLVVFLVLLLTDILGYTKVFPFTRHR